MKAIIGSICVAAAPSEKKNTATSRRFGARGPSEYGRSTFLMTLVMPTAMKPKFPRGGSAWGKKSFETFTICRPLWPCESIGGSRNHNRFYFHDSHPCFESRVDHEPTPIDRATYRSRRHLYRRGGRRPDIGRRRGIPGRSSPAGRAPHR